VSFIGSSIFARQQDGAAGETGLEGIERGALRAFLGARTGKELSIRLISGDLLELKRRGKILNWFET
jgi:hypothetical protein